MLSIKNLHASIADKPILNGVDLTISSGEVHVIMGPNGSGKSTLANVLMGNPKYEVSGGEVVFLKKNIADLSPDERAAMGLFMAFQYPREVGGVQLDRFLYLAYTAVMKARGTAEAQSVFDFNAALEAEARHLKMNPELVHRSLNAGFSGGEKKKAEMLQMSLLKPALAVLDETDSGLDVDALKIVGEAVNRYRRADNSVLIITHYNRLLEYVIPDVVHVMVGGRIVRSGGKELVKDIEEKGYQNITQQ